jgi:hypothetical protein
MRVRGGLKDVDAKASEAEELMMSEIVLGGARYILANVYSEQLTSDMETLFNALPTV